MHAMHTPLSDHVSAERLAALADDELTTSEAAHVAECPSCVADISAHRRLLRAARDEARIPTVPLTRWETLAPQLAAAGLIRRRATRWPVRIAAALVFTAGGALVGRYTATPHMVPAAGPITASVENLDSMPIFHSAAE